LYTLGEYYLAVCGAQGIQNLPVCFKLQNMRIGKYEVVSNDELPFYGVLVAKK
jgi:hypothetical protein